jgi:hypothetical protein
MGFYEILRDFGSLMAGHTKNQGLMLVELFAAIALK